MDDQAMAEFVERYVAAWESREPGAMAEHWHQDGVLHHPALSRTISGDVVARNNDNTKAAIGDFEWHLSTWASTGDTLFIAWRNQGRVADRLMEWSGVDGCPASPHPANVRTYVLDAAAEHAGHRPCLRCRPDRRGPPEHFEGVPHVVDHALHAICNGALDTLTERDLATQIFVSARHLRRMFVQHLGTSPTRVAISRRAHFVRRLIDETDLPVAQVAFAAGFGSVRAFNTAFRRTFDFTPSELRSRQTRTGVIDADGGIVLTLPVGPETDVTAATAGLSAVPIVGVEDVSDAGYTRTIVLAGHPGAIRIDRTSPELLRVEAHLPRFDRLIEVVSALRRLFDDTAPGEPLGWTAQETAIKRLLSSQLGGARASEALVAMTELYGRDLWPLRPFGLTHTNVDYTCLSSGQWEQAGLSRDLAERCQHLGATTAAC